MRWTGDGQVECQGLPLVAGGRIQYTTLGRGSVVVAVAFAHLVFPWRPADAQRAPRPRWTVGALFIQFDRPASFVTHGSAGIAVSRDGQPNRMFVFRGSGSWIATIAKEHASIGFGGEPQVPAWLALTDVQLLVRPLTVLPLSAVGGAGVAIRGGGGPLPRSRGFTRWGVEFGDPTKPHTFAAQMWGVRFATGMGSLRTGLAFTVLYRW